MHLSTGCFSPTPILADISLLSSILLCKWELPLSLWKNDCKGTGFYMGICIPTTQYCTWFKKWSFSHSSNSQWEVLSKELFFKIKFKKPQSREAHGCGMESFYLSKSVWNTESIQRRGKRKTTLWLPGFLLFKNPLTWFHLYEVPAEARSWETESSMGLPGTGEGEWGVVV